MKKALIAIFAALTIASAVAQINDWKPTTGQQYSHVFADGNKHFYSILYSPSTFTRTGDIVNVTIETPYTDNTPTSFFVENLNCRTRQYNYAVYDTDTNPPTLGSVSDWKDIQPNTSGEDEFPFFCGK
jgi:hypothetical protein